MQDRLDIGAINRLSERDFVHTLGGVFEHAPWVATRAAAARPFADLAALHDAMMDAVARAPRAEQIALLCNHPELAGREAQAGELTAASSSEQASLGLTALARGELATITRLNAEYRRKFGFPCIIAVRLHPSKESIFREMERRLANDRDAEIENGLEQVGWIARFRLERLLGATLAAGG